MRRKGRGRASRSDKRGRHRLSSTITPAHASCPRNTSSPVVSSSAFIVSILIATYLIDEMTGRFRPSGRFLGGSWQSGVPGEPTTSSHTKRKALLPAAVVATALIRVLEHLHAIYILVSSFFQQKIPCIPPRQPSVPFHLTSDPEWSWHARLSWRTRAVSAGFSFSSSSPICRVDT